VAPSIYSDDIPPTPPPKSPSAKYLSSFRRFASTRSHGNGVSRHSVSMSSEISSSDDSVAVQTPPDNSPGFADSGSGLLLENRPMMRTVTTPQSQRPGSVINVPWPSLSPKKNQGSLSRATSFAEKMFRGRKKSSASIMSSMDVAERMSGVEPFPNLIPELPNVLPPSPSLHELVMLEVPDTSFDSLHPPPSTPPPHNRDATGPPIPSTRSSWISTTSSDSATRSPLFDKDVFDAFPSVPQTVPSPSTRSAIAGHAKEFSQSGSIFGLDRPASIRSTSTLGPNTVYRESTDLL